MSIKAPNHTQFPNIILDKHWAQMTLAQVKVIGAIARKTLGWHKTSDRISYSQLQKMTGLSVNALKAGIKGLIDLNLIIQTETKFGYVYDMNYQEVSTSDMGVSLSDIAISTSDTIGYHSVIPQKIKETNKKEKKTYAPHVAMTEEAYEKLCNRFGKNKIDGYIEKVSDWMLSTGKKRVDMPATIRNWIRRDGGIDNIKILEKPVVPKCPKCGKPLYNEIRNNADRTYCCNEVVPGKEKI